MNCNHRAPKGGLSILHGFNGGYQMTWCTRCGHMTWAGDGLVSVAEALRSDYDKWVAENVTAWGCQVEASGEPVCKKYCGSRNCVVSLRSQSDRDSSGETEHG